MIAKVTPHYPPFGKRILLDNGWYKTLLRKNVDLVTTGIARMDSEGAVLEDGTKLPLDMLVLATGYDVVRFLTALQIYGRSGVSLRDT
ncbi:MAG: hypothetical protein IPF97_06280 [Sphingomonadales bacterium]|nr:hypothetical protein [Sphingomonadales bacterium]